MGKYLINASNLHEGGALSVSTSFIYELYKTKKSANIALLLSSAMLRSLTILSVDLSKFESCEVFDSFGAQGFSNGLRAKLNNYKVVFTVFGPVYTFKLSCRHIVGFAHPWIIYPQNAIEKNWRLTRRIRYRVKSLLQALFFLNADIIIVELPHVRKGLKKHAILRGKKIKIVNSTIDSVFFDKSRWEKTNLPINKKEYNLGIIAKDYPHKNLDVLAKVAVSLLEDYSFKVTFWGTFSEDEWSNRSVEYKKFVRNAGRLNLNQCPSFYSDMDGVFFPSLLEGFSSVPIEAMVMEKPLFASGFDFIRECCDDYPIYFDPLNVSSMSSAVYNFFTTGTQKYDYVGAKNKALTFNSSSQRAEKYLSIFCNEL